MIDSHIVDKASWYIVWSTINLNRIKFLLADYHIDLTRSLISIGCHNKSERLTSCDVNESWRIEIHLILGRTWVIVWVKIREHPLELEVIDVQLGASYEQEVVTLLELIYKVLISPGRRGD